MRLAPNLLNCRVNIAFFLLKTMRFFLVILKKTKNKYHGNITFIAIAKLVTYT